MKLFQITEPTDDNVLPGILIQPNQDPVGIELGRGETQRVLPLGPSQKKRLEQAVKAGIVDANMGIPLVRADIIDQDLHPRLTTERDRGDARALVYIEVATINGEVTFKSNVYEEEIQDGRVQRVYKPFEAAAGIKVVAQEIVEIDGARWPDALLLLQPGASFRVIRTGKLEGDVPEFLVTWNGFKLRTIIPAKHKRAELGPS